MLGDLSKMEYSCELNNTQFVIGQFDLNTQIMLSRDYGSSKNDFSGGFAKIQQILSNSLNNFEEFSKLICKIFYRLMIKDKCEKRFLTLKQFNKFVKKDEFPNLDKITTCVSETIAESQPPAIPEVPIKKKISQGLPTGTKLLET